MRHNPQNVDQGARPVPGNGGQRHMARKNDTSDMLDVIAVMEPEGKPLKGMRICITGHLSKTRTEVQDLIRNSGGEVEESVRYGTTHLVSNEDWTKNSLGGKKVSSKYEKAKRFGVKIISEQALLDLIIRGDSEARKQS
jgi:NAD-dependent DNA ligase